VSFLFKSDSRAHPYRRHLLGRTLAVSFMTVAELELWMVQRGWGAARRARLDQLLLSYVVHPYDRPLCRAWAEVTVQARRRGQPIALGDAWIAATALHYRLPLVTHNRRHYAGVEGLIVVSES
jgi:predicted nucleic acid-binding protein